MLIDNIFSYINNLKRSPILFVSPLVYAVGNCAEEIHFALLRAKKENKKLIILYPYNLPFFLVKYNLTNIELFKIDSEYIFFREEGIFFHLLRFLMTLVYFPLRLASLWMEKYFSRSLNESYRTPRIGISNLWQPLEKINQYSWDTVRLQKWGNQFTEKLPVRLRKNSYEQGNNNLLEMGLSSDDWFVCIHVRESGFRNDSARREYRNAHIENYVKACERIIEKGGWVIRMGDNSMTPLPKMEQVIDYPFTKYKSDLMDVYLIKKCTFYIGCQSGILDIASLFQKPILIVNMIEWTHSYPWCEDGRCILKHIYSHSQKKILTIKEMFDGPWTLQNLNRTVSSEYEFIENTLEEIEEAVIEYMDLLELQDFKLSSLQSEANESRIKTYYHFFDTVTFTTLSDKEEMTEKYRFASRIEASKGAVCQNYLKKYWN